MKEDEIKIESTLNGPIFVTDTIDPTNGVRTRIEKSVDSQFIELSSKKRIDYLPGGGPTRTIETPAASPIYTITYAEDGMQKTIRAEDDRKKQKNKELLGKLLDIDPDEITPDGITVYASDEHASASAQYTIAGNIEEISITMSPAKLDVESLKQQREDLRKRSLDENLHELRTIIDIVGIEQAFPATDYGTTDDTEALEKELEEIAHPVGWSQEYTVTLFELTIPLTRDMVSKHFGHLPIEQQGTLAERLCLDVLRVVPVDVSYFDPYSKVMHVALNEAVVSAIDTHNAVFAIPERSNIKIHIDGETVHAVNGSNATEPRQQQDSMMDEWFILDIYRYKVTRQGNTLSVEVRKVFKPTETYRLEVSETTPVKHIRNIIMGITAQEEDFSKEHDPIAVANSGWEHAIPLAPIKLHQKDSSA